MINHVRWIAIWLVCISAYRHSGFFDGFKVLTRAKATSLTNMPSCTSTGCLPVLYDLTIHTEKLAYKKKIKGLYSFLLAWSSFRSINNGSTVLPDEFVVPNDSPWPIECWGMKLANKASNIRAGRIYNKPNEVALLNSVGFEWKPINRHVDRILNAIAAYTTQHGNAPIPKSFVVPRNEAYPLNTWGMKLGLLVKNFRYRGDYAEHQDRFALLGVTLDKVGIDTRQWDCLYQALVTYKAQYGDVVIPRKWVVPSEEPWPIDSWGMKLGYRVHNMIHRGDYILKNATYSELAAALGIHYREYS